MSDEILAAVIGGCATLISTVLAHMGSSHLRRRKSLRFRRRHSLPNALGRWECDWFDANGTVYVSDDVEIKRWDKNGQFSGAGTQPRLRYQVRGEVDTTRAMALIYRTEDFPTRAYVGVACLEFNQDGDELSGYWYGRASNGEFMGGATKWRRSRVP